MTDIFREHVFPKYAPEDVIKSKMNGFGDPALGSFSLLDVSVLAKDEYKEDKFEEEFMALRGFVWVGLAVKRGV